MRTIDVRNVALMALTTSFFIQVGAGIFALAVIGRELVAAPPRSLAMLQGPHAYDSGAFWQVAPAITGLLFALAIATNWRSRRRGLLLAAFVIFALSGALTVGLVAPIFAEVAAAGFRDAVDPALQARAATWYAADWGLRGVDLVAAIMLLVALTRPASDRAEPLT